MSLKDMFKYEPVEEVPVQDVPEPVQHPQPQPPRVVQHPAPVRHANQSGQQLQRAQTTLTKEREVIAAQGRRISELERNQEPRRRPAPAPRPAPRQPAPTLRPSARVGAPGKCRTSISNTMPRVKSFMGAGVPSSLPTRNSKRQRRL